MAGRALRAAARGKPVHVQPGDLDVVPASPPSPPVQEGLAQRGAWARCGCAKAVDQFKREIVERALERADGSWVEATRRLGMHRSNLHYMAPASGRPPLPLTAARMTARCRAHNRRASS